ncbi:MAG: hypothetical protein ACO31E_09025 [Phycisphaerales bacterium]
MPVQVPLTPTEHTAPPSAVEPPVTELSVKTVPPIDADPFWSRRAPPLPPPVIEFCEKVH